MRVSPQSPSVHPAGPPAEARHGAVTSGVHGWRPHGWRPHAVIVVSHAALVVLQAVQALAVTHLQCRAQGPHSPAHLGLRRVWVELLPAWGPVPRVQGPVAVDRSGGTRE